MRNVALLFLIAGGLLAAQQPQSSQPIDSHAADLKTTADIRKALRADESLSLAARNVRVTTANGEVTLRGRVNSESEKTAVARKVQNVVGTGKVTNDLTVPARKSPRKSESGG